MPDRSAIEALILESLEMLAEDFKLEGFEDPSADTPLYGKEGTLDSITLVNLIADIEEVIAEKFDLSITLADEKAISAKNSPYRSVRSLTEAVAERMPL